MIELEHSPLGGSAAHRFMNCEGSFLLQREQIEAGTFENIESEYAKLGTAAHELGAKAIATGLEPYEFLGEDFNGYQAGWPGGISLGRDPGLFFRVHGDSRPPARARAHAA
jgi:hypothetical protein